jgi:hypothetical protein
MDSTVPQLPSARDVTVTRSHCLRDSSGVLLLLLLLLLLPQGKVRVDHDRGELRLLVKVNVQGQGSEGRKSKAVKDLKQLSGGRGWFVTNTSRVCSWRYGKRCLCTRHSGNDVGRKVARASQL